ncbi:MAG: flagellar brake protein [Lachnospiraceae bacterium]|nr:flagellar brake protein [Lachnospiraceae bacterium]MDE6234018.1 flagellar brake protein [Lachnospiraceae bacterium]MDE6253695.1 flagellar brake protein [Lachnospiraceae bacterium]
MLSRIITPGNRIELTKPINQKKTEQKPKPFISQVYDILEDDQIKIAMPMVEGKVIPLPLHGRYDMCFYTSGGLYQAKAVITDRYKEDGLYILIVELASELKKFQRRQYFRLEYSMDVKFKSVTDEELIAAVSSEAEMKYASTFGMLDGISLDISGGGIRFTSREEINKNSNVIISINIGITEEIICNIAANIISAGRVQNRDKIYEYRAEFVNMKNSDREQLIRFIFDMERRLRKRS